MGRNYCRHLAKAGKVSGVDPEGTNEHDGTSVRRDGVGGRAANECELAWGVNSVKSREFPPYIQIISVVQIVHRYANVLDFKVAFSVSIS